MILITQVHGGAGRAIPEEVRLDGTVRTFNEQVDADVERRMREILDGVARIVPAGLQVVARGER